ncbi:hypothetical protein [Nonomuraea sp. NEAU-A123]|uniref:hypothetical protein n=1 Tax=Nonomuraea sp. NEAU-A123 TaxID=2839649 RepID=UPI001BE4A2DD|nr:hypothetical protein [Nonomuraea sp. NEAU-A123]MBT2233586.1 hypothetical protein [Nonomuraea sp. NEAU-A123]
MARPRIAPWMAAAGSPPRAGNTGSVCSCVAGDSKRALGGRTMRERTRRTVSGRSPQARSAASHAGS